MVTTAIGVLAAAVMPDGEICTGRATVKSKRRGRNLLDERGSSQASDLLSAFITSTPLAIISVDSTRKLGHL